MKAFATPVRWLGIGFLGMGALTFVTAGWTQIQAFDPEELAGLVVPLLFVAAGGGLIRLSRRMRDDPSFEVGHLGGVIFSAVGAAMVAGGIVLTFQDPGGIALIVFGLVFLGAGWVSRKLFVTPEGMKRVAVQSGDATLQHGLGRETRISSTEFINVPEDATQEDIARAREDWLATRLAHRDDWASGVIEQEANRHRTPVLIGAAGFFVLCVVIVLIGAFVDGFFYFFALFTGIASALLFTAAVMRSIRSRKFGASRFHMDPLPVAPGETLTGVIRSEASRSSLNDGQSKLTLSCKRVVRHSNGNRTNTKTTTLWSAEHRVPAEGDAALTVPVAFDIPEGLPSATAGRGERVRHQWELEMRAAAQGLDLVAVFTLPVFEKG